jgi:leucyl aminopeptidase
MNAFTANTSNALPLHVLNAEQFPAWRETQTAAIQAWCDTQKFTAAPGSLLLLPNENGMAGAVIGIGDALDACSYSHAPFGLPVSDWKIANELNADALRALQLGWGLGAYKFSRYKKPVREAARLALENFDEEISDILTATTRVRDWVNTPTEHMGPDEMETAAREIASAHGASMEVIADDALLAKNFPAIHAVGRASHRAPRLISLAWGNENHPHIAIVGKGVCFDTGGLDIKPADGMRHMKKDMGGAAHALALAAWVMARQLPLRLSVLIPAVENSIGPNALRPGEIIATRAGVSVEIDNTDAEGRLVLCDALTFAGELKAQTIIDFATLTGAARVALGPDLPALFSNNDALANDWLHAGEQTRDAVWRMPLWKPYMRYLNSHPADLANAGSRMAGAVTAALYLQRFVPEKTAWAHLDTYAWNDSDRAGHPVGGEALGLRSAYAVLKARAAL